MNDVLSVAGRVDVYETRCDHIVLPGEVACARAMGYLVLKTTTHNLVTDIGLQAMLALLGGGRGVHDVGGSGYGPNNFTDLVVNRMVLTSEAAPSTPAPEDTGLDGTPVKTFHSDYPAQGDQLLTSYQVSLGVVRFSGLIQPQSHVGVTFREEGLFTVSGKLVARTTFSVEKQDNVGLQVDHTIMIQRLASV